MKALLISTYDLGRQPFGLASPAAWLKSAGWEVRCADLAKSRLDETTVAEADLVGVHLPMHTAARLAGPVLDRVRRINPAARMCAFGLYAPLNEGWLRSHGVEKIFGGEFEGDLVEWAKGPGASPGVIPGPPRAGALLPRLEFLVPDRTGLPPLTRYATLQRPDGSRSLVGSTEASRGCRHLCRHCPVVPVYEGHFRIVQPDVVLADIEAQIANGAGHITFGDPDFFNGPSHGVRIAEALHAAHPDVTYDVTIKIEHLLQHRALLPRLVETGCVFVTSAVESVDDRVLELLQKGHTRDGFIQAVAECRAVGLALVPTFVAFHPWLTLEGYCDLLDTLVTLDLVDCVAPIQLAIRLLVPQGSRLLELDELRPHLGPFDPLTLSYAWTHPDPRVDELWRAVSKVVEERALLEQPTADNRHPTPDNRLDSDRAAVFDTVAEIAHSAAGLIAASTRSPWDARPHRDRCTVPYLNEPWYC